MYDKDKKPGDIVRAISLADLLTSIGITSALVANDIIGTDNMYSQRWQIQTASTLGAISELLAAVVKRDGNFLAATIIDLPDGVLGVVTANPLSGHSMSTPPSEEEGYDIATGDDFPF